VCGNNDGVVICHYADCSTDSDCATGAFCWTTWNVCYLTKCSSNSDCPTNNFVCERTGHNSGGDAIYFDACIPGPCTSCASNEECRNDVCVTKPVDPTPTSEPTPRSTEKKSPIAAIVGSLVGVLVLCAIIGAAIYFYMRNKKKKEAEKVEETSNGEPVPSYY